MPPAPNGLAELHQKLAIDLDYLRRRSLRSDLLILARTVLLFTDLVKPAAAPRRLEEPDTAGASRAAPTKTAQPSAVLAIQLPQSPVAVRLSTGPGTRAIPLPSTEPAPGEQTTVFEPENQHRGWSLLELLGVMLVAAMAGSALVLLIKYGLVPLWQTG